MYIYTQKTDSIYIGFPYIIETDLEISKSSSPIQNTAARRSIPGCMTSNPKNLNKKAPELKLVGYPFLYIPVDIPPCFAAARTTMSPGPRFMNVCDAAVRHPAAYKIAKDPRRIWNRRTSGKSGSTNSVKVRRHTPSESHRKEWIASQHTTNRWMNVIA